MKLSFMNTLYRVSPSPYTILEMSIVLKENLAVELFQKGI